MSEIITLSSDEEDSAIFSKERNCDENPPSKRKKTEHKPVESSVVILSDEEEKPVIVLDKEKEKPIVLDEEVKVHDGTCNMDSIEISKENDCEIIDLDKEDPEKTDEKENMPENPRMSVPEPTCFTLLHNFLDVCETSLKNSPHADVITKFPNMWKIFKQCESRLSDIKAFRTLIDECTNKANKSPVRAAVAFKDVYVFIKEVCSTDEVQVTKEDRRKLKKLETCINLLVRKIKNLEESEVDFDDGADSTYIQCDRYQNRLNKVYSKYCELLKKDPYSGRLTRAKLVFTNSHHDQINRAISKKFKNNDKFPTYFDMENLIRKVVEDENLKLGEAEMKAESSHCFKKLGELLQTRRKKELFDTHYSFIQDSEDPANEDCRLNSTLNDSYIQGQQKMDKIYEEFVIKAETTKDEVSQSHSSDSEDSDKVTKEVAVDASTASKSIE